MSSRVVARFKERYGTSGAKSDKGDAHALADMVRIDRDQLRQHPRLHTHFTPTGSSWINRDVRHEVA